MHSKFTSPHRAPTSIFLFGAHAKTLSAPYKMLLADCDSVSHSKLKPGKEENEGPCLSRLVSYRVLNQWIDAHRIAKKADSRCGWPRDMVPWLSHEALQCWWRSHDRFISLSLVLVSKFKWFNQAKTAGEKRCMQFTSNWLPLPIMYLVTISCHSAGIGNVGRARVPSPNIHQLSKVSNKQLSHLQNIKRPKQPQNSK